MVVENQIPKTETVYELKEKYEIPSFEEFMRNYEMDENLNYDDLSGGDISEVGDYGPTSRNDKGKKKERFSSKYKNDEHWIDTINGVAGESADWWKVDESADKKGDWHALSLETSAGASGGLGGMIASGSASASAFRLNDGLGDIRIGSASIGGEIGAGAGATAKYSASIDAVNFNTKGISGNIGLDVGSGGSVGPTGVEVKFLGFGVDVGKKTGFSTPFGGLSVNFEETCKQQ